MIGFLDASYRNNEGGPSQKGMTVFLAESREHSSKDGSLVDCESQKIQRTVLSTTVAEIVFTHEMFWFMAVPPWIVDGLVR